MTKSASASIIHNEEQTERPPVFEQLEFGEQTDNLETLRNSQREIKQTSKLITELKQQNSKLEQIIMTNRKQKL